MLNDVKHYVNTCDKCQRTKVFPAKPMGLLQPNAVPQGPWEDISADLITGLPESSGYDAILVVVDRFTKMIHLAATNATLTSAGLVKLYLQNVWKFHGMLKNILVSVRVKSE